MDAQKLNGVTRCLAFVGKFPVLLVVSIILLFNFLGISACSVLAMFAIAGISNYIFARINAKMQKKVMAAQDERMKTTTEVLNNIKMLKFYGWTKIFEDKIS